MKTFSLFAIPGLAVALLPSLACPLCWPAYAALLSSLGLGFLGTTAYLLPLTGVFLAIALLGFSLEIKTHGYKLTLLGLASAAMILLGKFLFNLPLLTYSGIILLLITSVWNILLQRTKNNISCSIGE